jgi:GxxExxY protein
MNVPKQRDTLSHLVIGRAMEVHRDLGPGINEEFYHRSLSEKLSAAGVDHEFKPRTPLLYRGHVADVFEPDLVIPGRLIPELKTLRGPFGPSHFTQLLVYLKFWRIPVGLLIDFAKESLVAKRIAAPAEPEARFPECEIPPFVSDKGLANLLLKYLEDILADHGLGYRETTYRGLLCACIKADEMDFLPDPGTIIPKVGTAKLRCIQIGSRAVVLISALGHGLLPADRAILQTYLRWLNLPWGIAVHYGKEAVDVRFVKAPGSGKFIPTDSEPPPIGFSH